MPEYIDILSLPVCRLTGLRILHPKYRNKIRRPRHNSRAIDPSKRKAPGLCFKHSKLNCCWAPLTKGAYTLVSICDKHLLENQIWSHDGSDGYAIASSKEYYGKLHCYVLKYFGSKYIIDHKNRKRYDNRRFNLRKAKRSDNSHNAGVSVRNKTGYKGVSIKKQTGRYKAAIKPNAKSKEIHLGYFDTAIEAAIAYDTAARKYHGEFAFLNFVGGCNHS